MTCSFEPNFLSSILILKETDLEKGIRTTGKHGLIQVCEYDPKWREQFEILRDRLFAALSGIQCRIEHVGSTSVEGLWAKPVIDIDIIVGSFDKLPDVISALSSLGYSHIGNLGIEGREALKHQSPDVKHNLYVCEDGCIALKNHLFLRDHLLKNDSDRKKYSQIKRTLAEKYPDDIDSYIEGKTEFILSILRQYEIENEDLKSISAANKKPSTDGNDRVARFYNQNWERELNRFKQDAYHEIEYLVTLAFLKKYLKPSQQIIEIGSGPAPYTSELARDGRSVMLVDVSQKLLELAEQKLESSGLGESILGYKVLSAVDLKGIKSDEYDLATVFGPLYHLTELEERKACVSEAMRVTKPGGIVLFATINRYAALRDLMHGYPEEFVKSIVEREPEIRSWSDHGGINLERDEGFTKAYLSTVEETKDLLKEGGFSVVEVFACEGIAAFLDEKAEIIRKNKEAWKKLIQVVVDSATDPTMLGSSEHCVYIVRKPS